MLSHRLLVLILLAGCSARETGTGPVATINSKGLESIWADLSALPAPQRLSAVQQLSLLSLGDYYQLLREQVGSDPYTIGSTLVPDPQRSLAEEQAMMQSVASAYPTMGTLWQKLGLNFATMTRSDFLSLSGTEDLALSYNWGPELSGRRALSSDCRQLVIKLAGGFGVTVPQMITSLVRAANSAAYWANLPPSSKLAGVPTHVSVLLPSNRETPRKPAIDTAAFKGSTLYYYPSGSAPETAANFVPSCLKDDGKGFTEPGCPTGQSATQYGNGCQ